MKDRFYAGMQLPVFVQAIIDSWDSIDIRDINKLISTMPKRIDELNKKHGGPTNYYDDFNKTFSTFLIIA